MRRRSACGLWLSVLGLGLPAFAAEASAQQRAPGAERSALEVIVITIGQGELYFEKYGHNMLLFRDESTGLDLAFNWGTFDFAEPGYFWRVIVGDPMYWVDTVPGRAVEAFYRSRNRTVTFQRLNLTPAQATRALELARASAGEANKYYRYDYYLDNCSTRIRDLLDAALDGALRRSTQDTTTLSYRSETVRLLDDLKVTQLGVVVALGRPAGRPLTTWESMFIPMRMRDALRDVRVTNDGREVPLVAVEQDGFVSPTYRDRAEAPTLRQPYLAIGILIAIGLLAGGIAGEQRRAVDIAFRAGSALWTGLTGGLGLVVLLGWVATQHTFWYANENLMLVNPLALAVSTLMLLSLRSPRWSRPAAIAAILVAMCGALELMAKALPGAQDNVALIGLVFPSNLALAYILWRRAREAASGFHIPGPAPRSL